MFHISWRSWINRIRKTSQGRPRPRGYFPRVEGLEQRWVPTLTVGQPNFTGLEGIPGNPITATFVDSEPQPSSNDYTATIDPGDGTGPVTAAITGYDPATGKGTISLDYIFADEGEFTVTATITVTADGTSGSNSSAVSVGDAPLTLTPTAVSATEGLAFSGQLATFTDANPNAPLSDFVQADGSGRVSIQWGDNTTTGGTITQPGGTGTVFVISADHTYAEEGTHTITITLHDVGGQTQVKTTTATIADAPLTLTPAPVGAVEGNLFKGTVAFLDDANPTAPLSDFTTAPGGATISWGDNTGTTTGTVVLGSGSSAFEVTGSHTYAATGTYTVTVTVKDAGGQTETMTTTATVTDAQLTLTPTPVNATEGLAFSGQVATFTDADPNATVSDFNPPGGALIDWGDNTTSAGTVTQPGGKGTPFVISGSHTYVEEGSFTVTITITDVDGNSATGQGTATVADANLTVTTSSVSATEGQAFSGQVATFTDANPKAPLTDFQGGEVGEGGSVVIDWGDNTTSEGTVTQPGGVGTPFVVTGDHVYAEEGTYTVKVTVMDAGGKTVTGTSTATVADAALTINLPSGTLTEGNPFSGPIATFSDANPNAPLSDFTTAPGGVTINWGDNTTSTGTVTQAGGTGTDFLISGDHTYAEEGTYTITITVKDVGGATKTATSTVTVGDAALIATAVPVTVPQGLTANNVVVATFTDLGGPEPVGTYTATINWGDGTPPTTAGVHITLSGTTFTVFASHTFANPGPFNVTVTIADEGGSTTTVSAIASVGSANDLFVNQVYLDLLHRLVDSGSLAYWEGQLNGGLPRSLVALAVESSLEFRTNLVTNAYKGLLKRAPDPGALSFFTNFLATGGTAEQMQVMLVSSPEYYQNRGGGTRIGFLNALWQDALGRTIDPAALALFGDPLFAGQPTPKIASLVFSSVEYDIDLVRNFYEQYLRREPDDAAIGFVQMLQNGVTDQNVIAIILGSDEYFAGASGQSG
jgi:PKD repeat protein